MAVKPDTVLGLSSRRLNVGEERLLLNIELDVDEFLRLNFEKDYCPYYILTENLSLPAIHELLRRYRKAGWSVVAWPNRKLGTTLLYFTQPKRQETAAKDQTIPGIH
jgi:hypothetical protein